MASTTGHQFHTYWLPSDATPLSVDVVGCCAALTARLQEDPLPALFDPLGIALILIALVLKDLHKGRLKLTRWE